MSFSQSLVFASSSETPAPQAAMLVSAFSHSPGDAASSRSTGPAFEAALVARGAVLSEQTALGAVVAAPSPSGAL
eukprot:5830660-Lingulodinium_polyedra.AAC.1